MIQTIFPTKILINDFDKNDDWNHTICAFIRSHFTKAINEKGSYFAAGDEDISVFTEENMTLIPELRDLFNMFVDSFFELSQEFSNKTDANLSREEVEQKLSKDLGRLPLMRKGDEKGLHTHGEASAYGIFYLNDIDNEKEGGQLILHDPSFNSLRHFCDDKTLKIETKKHRMIIAPAHIWHEVSKYYGDEERQTIVLNLHF
jgi:hypothetical protein